MEFMGIGSGMDIQGIIDKLMAVESRPILKLESQKKDYTSMQSIWRDVNTRLSALSTSLDSLKLKADFEKVKVTSTNDKIATATAEANAIFGTYEIEVVNLAKAHKVRSEQQIEGYTTATEASFTINGKAVLVGAGATLKDIASAINATEDIGVTATVIANNLVIEAKETNKAITFEDTNGLLQSLGVLNTDGSVKNLLQAPESAEAKINGITVVSDKNTIENAVEGVKVNLVNVSLKATGENEKVTLTIGRDVDAIFDKIKGFVEEYKKVQSFLDNQTFFTPGNGTSGSKNSTGKLFGDSTVNILKTKLRTLFTDVVGGIGDGNLKMLSQIGIDVDRSGNVTLNETKLKEALNEKPMQVADLFIKEETGITAKMQNFIKSYTQYAGVIDNKVKYYENRIKDVEDSVKRWETRLEMKRNSLVRQFTALDKAMTSNFNQSSWLSSQLSQLGGMY